MKTKTTNKRVSYYKRLQSMKRMVEVQTSTGNYDYDRYMLGMANGMILCESIMENKEPQFLSTPDKWLSDEREEKKAKEKVDLVDVLLVVAGIGVLAAVALSVFYV